MVELHAPDKPPEIASNLLAHTCAANLHAIKAMNTVFMKHNVVSPYLMLWGKLSDSLANAEWLQNLEHALTERQAAAVRELLEQGQRFFRWEYFSAGAKPGESRPPRMEGRS